MPPQAPAVHIAVQKNNALSIFGSGFDIVEGHVCGAPAKRLLHFYVSVDESSFLFSIAALHYQDRFAVKQCSEPLTNEIEKRQGKAGLHYGTRLPTYGTSGSGTSRSGPVHLAYCS